MKNNKNKSNSMTYIFNILFLLIAAGIFFKTCGSKYVPSFVHGGVAPVEEWENIIIGKWKYNYDERSETNNYAWLKEAEVQYNKDSTFIKRKLKLRYFKNSSFDNILFRNKEDLKLLAGGLVMGKWGIEDEIFKEAIDSCDFETSIIDYRKIEKDYDPCIYDYKMGTSNIFGNYITNTKEFKIQVFSRNKIIIKGEDISDESIIKIELIRIDK